VQVKNLDASGLEDLVVGLLSEGSRLGPVNINFLLFGPMRLNVVAQGGQLPFSRVEDSKRNKLAQGIPVRKVGGHAFFEAASVFGIETSRKLPGPFPSFVEEI